MWQARPVFVSSTFLDMQAERDYLRTHVFPEFEELLRRRNRYLEWVDLRVGIATGQDPDESAREQKILKTCLAEVERCRPYLIVLLGDRYGWVPPVDQLSVAAAEVGLSGEIAGRSVTELEIVFGALSNPDQLQRTLFYFRKPLPYASMRAEIAATYCDGFDERDDAGRDRARKLEALKQRIRQGSPSGKVPEYRAKWDAKRQAIVGFEDWTVREDLLKLLGLDVADQASIDAPWHEERQALDAFVADRTRTFVGRRAILDSLASLAAGTAESAHERLFCLTGDPGSGKSAVFSALHRRLNDENGGVLILSHAASASLQSASVDRMLQRWCDELASELGVASGVSTGTHPQALDARFAELLSEVAGHRRVVLLIDALDQFTSTRRALHCNWLPDVWPGNARLIATAIGGASSEALASRGARIEPIAPLVRGDAAEITAGITSRYHRSLESEVVDQLLDKPGAPWRNPLWLVLATEELNLLGADEFSRIQSYPGSPAKQLRALMLDLVDHLPADIQGLYEASFDRAELLFGARWVKPFLGLLFVGRLGWRESDFRHLLPMLAAEPWDELRFAQLRRHFRGQLRQSTTTAAWGFTHGQMRLAIGRRLSLEDSIQFHSTLADFLRPLADDDPLRISETMVHLLGCKDLKTAADFYIGDLREHPMNVQHPPPAVRAATQVLAEPLIAEATSHDAVANIEGMFCAVDGDVARMFNLTQRVMGNLDLALDAYAPTEVRIRLHELCATMFERLEARRADNPLVLHSAAIAHSKLGSLRKEQGSVDAALQSFRRSNAICERLAAVDRSAATQPIRGMNGSEIGEILAGEGKWDEAISAYQEAENHFPNLRERLVVSGRLGGIYVQQGRLEEALSTFETFLEMAEMLDAGLLNPRDFPDVAIAHKSIGDVLARLDRAEEASSHYHAAFSLMERLIQQDPRRTDYRRVLQATTEARSKLLDRESGRFDALGAEGAALEKQDRHEEALAVYSKGLAVADHLTSMVASMGLAAVGPRKAAATAQFHRGRLLALLGRREEAAHALEEVAERADDIAAAKPEDDELRRLASAARAGLTQLDAARTSSEALIEEGRALCRMQGSKAYGLLSEGKLDSAKSELEKARAIARQLAGLDETACEEAVVDMMAGDIELGRADPAAARKHFLAARQLAEHLLSRQPGREDCRRIVEEVGRRLQSFEVRPATATRVEPASETASTTAPPTARIASPTAGTTPDFRRVNYWTESKSKLPPRTRQGKEADDEARRAEAKKAGNRQALTIVLLILLIVAGVVWYFVFR
jgi:tetratricopeptide (TPR) repeat protein